MRASRLLGLLLGSSLWLTVLPAGADWLPTQRAEFMRNCVGACDNNPTLRPEERGQCRPYCECVADEGERIFSAEDYDDLDGQARRGETSEKLQRFRALFGPCSRSAFGR